MSLPLIAVAAVLVVAAAIIDLRTREIPDAFPIALLALALVGKLAGWSSVTWLGMLAGCVVGFLIPALLFWRGAMGGGDVKLLAALGAGLGLQALLSVLFWTAILGGLLALAILARRGAASDEGEDEQATDPELAYGPAIAAGLLVAWIAGQLSPEPLA